MDKTALNSQLKARLRDKIGVAVREMHAAVEAAKHGADAKTKREDARMALEYGALAKGQRRQIDDGKRMLEALDKFAPGGPRGGRIRMGSVVEVEDEEHGVGRTFFLAPAGAGMELTGPGGDGILSVVTPNSPIGKAVIGQEVGDSVDVVIERKTRSWEITWVD